MNIICNTRPSINNFRIVYYRGQKYSRWQNLVTGSTADLCHPVADPVSKRIAAGYLSAYWTWLYVSRTISLLRNVSVRFCWCYFSPYWNVTRRLANYQPVTKRVSTFLLMIFIISIYYSYLFVATIDRMHNNSVCQGLMKTTFLLSCANFIQKELEKNFVFSTIALIYWCRGQKWLLIECAIIYF